MPNVPVHVERSTEETEFAEELEPDQEATSTVDEKPEDQRRHAQRGTVETPPDSESVVMWRDRAQRLQAEIENYRKRQRRLAEEQIASERQRLLNAFAHVADDLGRALDAGESDVKSLRRGVELTYRNLLHLLSREGVEPIEAQGVRFDPALHEAVATVSQVEAGVQPQTVIEVTERGYLLGDRLLRPARVIVAV